MPVSSLNRSQTIAIPMNANTGSGIVTIIEANAPFLGSEISNNYKVVSYNCFLKNLKAFAKIESLPEAPLPDFELTDSATQKLAKTLDIEWSSPRKQLNLFIKQGNQNWNLLSSVSLLNPSGYPFRIYSLLDLLTDNLAYELGRGSALGVNVEDVGFGSLSGNDQVTIHGSYVEEYYLHSPPEPSVVVNNYSGGGTPTVDPNTLLVGNDGLIDNSFNIGN